MAAIDKIYGTRKEWKRLYNFLKRKKPKYKKRMYPKPHTHALDFPIANFGSEEDQWLMNNCKLDFVIKRLKEQYPEWNSNQAFNKR